MAKKNKKKAAAPAEEAALPEVETTGAEEEAVAEEAAAESGTDLSERAQEVWLAGLAAFKKAGRKGGKEFTALVARGEQARAAATGAGGWTIVRIIEAQEAVEERAGEAIGIVVERALDAAGVARKRDLDGLRRELLALEDRLAKLSGGEPTPALFRLQAHADGWAVVQDGTDEPLSVHATKKKALKAGRSAARAAGRSRLVVHGADGAEQEAKDYGG